MTLIITEKIKKIKTGDEENKESKEIIVSFAKEYLTISEDSEDWTNDGINKFLINLASKTPDGENIELAYDTNNKDVIFLHIITLFKEFVKEYNKNI